MSASGSSDPPSDEAQKPSIFSSHDFMEFLKTQCDDISELTVLTKSGTVVSASFNGASSSMDPSVFKSSDWLKSLESQESVKPEVQSSLKSEDSGAPLNSSLGGALNSKDWMADYKTSHVEVTYSQSFNNPLEAVIPAQKPPRIPSATLPLKKRTDWKSMFETALAPKPKPQPQESQPEEVFDWYSSSNNEPLSSLVEAASRATPQPVTESLTEPSSNAISMSDENKLTKQQKHAKRKSRKIIPDVKEYIDDYSERDVLFGRGGRSNHHPGNKLYREKVTDMQPHYRSCDKNEKTKVAQSIVDEIHQLNGRFLELDKPANRWYIVPNIVARRKVGQALREINTEEARAAKREKYGQPKSKR